ncbi:putative addiction module antidote protein [Patescibacteria group bacterium]|nr:putative addiction module antidote protein [Patescibacteria group bacterium]
MKISKYNTSDYLKTEKDIKEYLNASFVTGDSKLIAKALGDVAKIKGMSKIAEASELDRSSLYSSLTKQGDPKLSTVTKLIKNFGYSVSIS